MKEGKMKQPDFQPPAGLDRVVGHFLPGGIATDFICLPALLTAGETLGLFENRRPTAVVIRRLVAGRPLFYLLRRDELETALTGAHLDETLEAALHLHESNSCPELPAALAGRAMRRGIAERTVITDEGRVVGYWGLARPAAAVKKLRRGIPPGPAVDFPLHLSVEKAPVKKMGGRRGTLAPAPAGPTIPETGALPVSMPVKTAKKKGAAPGTPKPAAPAVSGALETPPPCYFGAEMPEEIKVGKSRQVEITISREAIGLASGEASREAAAPLPALPGQILTVRLIPKKNIDVIGQARADVNAPLPGEPACTLFFEVQSGSPGACELWVAFCRGPLSLVTLKLKPQAVAGKPQEEGARLKAASEATPPSGPPARINIMRVYLGENGGKIRYRYTLWLDALGVDQEYESPEFAGDIKTILQPYMNLFDQVETADKTDFEQLQIELRSIGARLFQTLFPPDLQSVFWENRDRITHLKLYCEEPYIPWEILHVCEPGKSLPSETRFLGQMGLVRWLYGHTAPTELRVRPGRAWYVTPSYPGHELASAKKEGTLLKKLFDAKPVTPATRPEVTKLLGAEGPFDLFHFAGHGEASETAITEGRIELDPAGADQGGRLRDLTPDIVAGLCRLKAQDGTRPIVVLNSCRAGKTGYQLTGLGGFAPAFLEREAAVFVGALWMIGDAPALTFVQAFYQALCSGKVVAEAVSAGREAAFKAGDATYLAYVVYADPFARLVA
jgi:hypothetical protein